jgi:hypothetical protein
MVKGSCSVKFSFNFNTRISSHFYERCEANQKLMVALMAKTFSFLYDIQRLMRRLQKPVTEST